MYDRLLIATIHSSILPVAEVVCLAELFSITANIDNKKKLMTFYNCVPLPSSQVVNSTIYSLNKKEK